MVHDMNRKTYNIQRIVREKKSCGHSPLVRRERTLGTSRAYSQYVGSVLHTLRYAVLLMMVMMGMNVWGQTDYSGVYYLSGNNQGTDSYNVNNTTTNYYLCPTENWIYYQATNNITTSDNGQPFLTTYQYRNGTNDYTKAVWIIVKHSTENYYYIIHAKDGMYMTSNAGITGSNSANRIRVHLEETNSPTDNMLFDITKPSFYDISPKNNSGWFLNITQGNRASLQGTSDKTDGPSYTLNGSTTRNVGGTIGLWNQGGDYTSKWYFEDAKAALTPTISDINTANNTFTITSGFVPTGCSIVYTTDGSDPSIDPSTTPATIHGTEYSGPVTVTGSITVKAAVIGYDMVLSNIDSKSLSPVIVAPMVTNNGDGTISLSTATTGATIYYTTNGDTPDNNSTPYSSAFSLGSATVIKAIAYLGSESSEVKTYNVPQYTTPTISFNSSTSQVTITSSGTTYYTTDGSTPNTSSTEYSAPFTVSSATTVKAIATHAGYLASEVFTLAITQVATPTIQDNGSNAISITSATTGATIYYTTDGSTPTTSSTEYTGPLTENVSGVTIKAIAVKENMIPSAVGSGTVTLQCATPIITRDGMSFSISCSMPTDATFYYSLDGSTPSTSYSGPVSFTSGQLPMTVKAVAKHANYNDSEYATFELLNGTGTSSDPYLIYGATDFANFISNVNAGTTSSACYKLETDISASGASAITTAFTGTFDGNFHTISGLGHALFNTVDGGTVKNIILKDVTISSGTNVGAICNEATGASRIYNCGILPTTVLRNDPDDNDKITGFSGSSIGGSGNVGGIVGLLSDNARVINCYSYATITGGATVAGIVGNIGYAANGTITQDDVDTKPMVVNCMFYGDITGGSNIAPVYGGTTGVMIKNDADKGVNPYCYFRKNASFHKKITFPNLESYRRSWPAEEKNLTRFEYYRSILNSNKRLCTYWITDKVYGSATNAPTEADEALVAKWVLDPSIAPYPILKEWGYYPSVINLDPENRYNPSTQSWESRSNANEWEGKSYGTLEVKINAGSNNSSADVVTKYITITDMDTLNCDYGYYKIQLPYYNEVFGNPNGATHSAKYGNNYTDKVVTGWNITKVNNSSTGTGDFTANWETGYNFADRNSTKKDLFSVSGRVFAQGGYYYVPKDVTSIEITAHWGKAVYLANRGHSIDRVKLTIAKDYKGDKPFTPAGTISDTFEGQTVYNDLQDAIQALDEYTSNQNPGVYNQAIVLIGNHQVQNGSYQVGYGLDSKWHPFTIMSADFDFDNEPDYCLQLQFRNGIDRPGIQPVRFDFLPIVELGLAVRHNKLAYAIGIMVPQGHFEITETAFMRTTQFEYDGHKEDIDKHRVDGKSPMIINGGEFESFNVRYNSSNRTSYFILGGKAWVHRFAPGLHPNASSSARAYLCAINAIGGEYKEFYLSGLYKAGTDAPDKQGAPHCYTNGGKFGTVAGTGYDKVAGGVTFKINHSLIGEFYGGGINGSNPLGGNIDVTIDYSRVNKYCGGPKVGNMTGKTVTTHATGTTFDVFYGGGNGGNSYYRQMQDDGDWPSSDVISDGIINDWNHRYYNWNGFNPLGEKDDGTDNKGYHAEYEFEVFNQSNGVADEITQRGFIRWIQFGITKTGNVSNTLSECKILNNFYGGGNLATVDGDVTSTLTDTEVDGDVFGAGYSAAIPTFQVHDKDNKTFPSMDFAGTITDGHIPYASTVYEWTNDLNGMSIDARKASPTYSKTVGGVTKWYCYTWNSLENLGAVTGTATLTINGTTTVAKSVYGGGEESGVDGDTEVNVNGGTIGTENAPAYGALVGNVYGGGKGTDDDVKAGLVKGNTKVTIQNTGSGDDIIIPMIYHNVYGGGAYGSVGDYTYDDTSGNITEYNSGGKTEVYIKGGTIGTNGKENGMIFGSSRGDVDGPGSIQDRLAWVHDTHVVIGTAGQGTTLTTPLIKGSVYGGGENGHTYENAVVDIHSGTIGIAEGEPITSNNGTPDDESDDITYNGPEYPYRGNVYGSGCGTDKYYADPTGVANPYDGNGDTYNPLAGIVYGNATVTMTGGHVVRNVYGAGAMGSVGKVASTTTGGLTTINISGGTVGVSGTVGDGNVFGAARGDNNAKGNDLAQVRLANVRETSVTISNGIIKGNVYGGGEVGSVGTYSVSTEGDDYMKIYTFENNTGACSVTINGGTIGTNVASVNGIFANGNVYGAGKGLANTFWCEKGMVYSTNVAINAGTVYGTVYGGGEVGRVENNATVTIGESNPEGTTPSPNITGNVFGAGAGIETHGYSALLRGDTEVTVQGNAHVGGSVYGGGEKASVGRFVVDKGIPKEPADDGSGDCTVTVQGNATIAGSVFGTGQGVTPHYYTDVEEYANTTQMPKRMMAITMGKFDDTNQDYWQYVSADDPNNVWEYLNTKQKYLDFLPTLALASHPVVTIDGNATVSGSVYGGGQRGITMGTVAVNINGGTVTEDVYGGGALADTNKGNWDASTGAWSSGKSSATFTTTVNLKGGKLRNAYGGGLGDANTPAYVWGDVLVDLNGTTTMNATTGKPTVNGTMTTNTKGCIVNEVFGGNNVNGTPKGDVMVHVYATQNKEKETIAVKFKLDNESLDQGTSEADNDYVARLKEILADKIEMAEALSITVSDANKALCNNESATATALKTAITSVTSAINEKTTDEINSVRYDVKAVYGGGNQAAYIPYSPYTTTNTTGAKTQVIIEGCEETSIETVYGGGNAAAVPETNVEIRSAYEIQSVFGGGNGYSATDNHTNPSAANYNPGADVGVYKEGTTETTYGTGYANAILKGGYIHEAYGGSNQKGNIKGKININMNPVGSCDLCVDKFVGAGKNADVDGDLIMILGCKPTTKTPLIFAGADNADVNGNVELTITSGTFGKVFGGNNLGGAIKGHLVLNIEETGCTPIKIDELYLGGNMAAYSRYGYYEDTSDNNKVKPRTAAMHAIAEGQEGYVAPLTNPENDATHTFPYAQPVLNIVSCTSIGKVFGGGLGAGAVMHADPTVNINMIMGTPNGVTSSTLGTIGDVYGGGNAANVVGSTTVNIGTETTVQLHESLQSDGVTYNMSGEQDVLGANITGNVYGGGKKADVGQYDVDNDHVDVAGNTYVNIGAKEVTVNNNQVWQSVAEGTSHVVIAGNVFGGGEGEAAESGDGAFKCAKAIVTGATNIHMGNGTVNGTVYGGGEVGRVEGNSVVAIGIGAGSTPATSSPEIKGDVFGAGKGKKTHGYSALLRGNPAVTIEGDAKVRGSVYGGGEIASVGRYNVKKGDNDPVGAPADVLIGMPYSLANSGSGYCTIIIQGNAEIGPESEMKMKTTSGIPDDTGHVIGGGKGVLPYDGYGVTDDDWVGDPWRVSINDQKDIFNSTTYPTNYEKEYFKYIETLALATETNVTIAGNAFVKGSVYGGSLNGHVQHDTHVNIAGGQIGQGEGVTKGRYTTADWASEYLAECPHWDYVENSGAPYDPLATASGTYDYTKYGFVQQADKKANSDGGLPEAKDGHTYYGNVFGGGSGVIPYAPGLWHRGAGSVGGDTYVNITGGHILSSVYGGNEHTDVGTYTKDASGQPTTTPAASNARGKCTVNMTGGTVGVPRTDEQKKAHPLVGNVYGAGKGDQRIFFNTWTNVINTEVNISGSARIYGSVFGGGEDGHVISDAETNIGNVTIKTGKNETENATANGLIIGTTGTSYNDGNVFGGGRGFSGEAQTAGTVGGNVRVNINAGSVYGSVYGGGRLASVGTMFEFPTLSNGSTNPAYGQFKEDSGGNTYGHVTINISGGTIGNANATGDEAKYSGNVFGGSMGRLNLLDGTRNPIWPKMAQVKETNVNISGTAVVRRSVYGGGELGTVRDNAYVTIGGQKTANADNDGNVAVTPSGSPTVMRDVYGGGYGSEDRNYTIFIVPELKSANADPTDPESYENHTYAFTPMQFAGCVGKNTYVNVAGGYIRKSVYGGGELASVGVINFRAEEVDNSAVTSANVVVSEGTSKSYIYSNIVKHAPVKVDNKDVYYGFGLSWPYEFEYVTGYNGATHVKVTGGRLGLKDGDTDTGFEDNGDVYGAGKGMAGDYKDYVFCANVGSTDVTIDHTSSNSLTSYSGTADLIAGAVYGGGEDGHVMGDTKVTISGGLIYHSVYGGGSGKGKFSTKLLKIGKTPGSTTETDYYTRNIYSITAGKVFGNTEVEMTGGLVVRNVYGGGNMGSVGKGNYSGGSDDYSTSGYGELPPQNNQTLWTSSTTGDFPWQFLHSGKCKVTITGGTVGYFDNSNFAQNMYPLNNNNRYDASLPYGNVFGGCRGESAPNITESPRYLYCPEFFVGYANETEVKIGKTDGSAGPTIKGSVYGGGMDGHVRRDASVTIYAGTIGETYDATKYDADYWMALGNVYGAGSGIGKYKYDFNYDNDTDDNGQDAAHTVTYNGKSIKEEDFSTSAGSVTRFTTVDIQGGTIRRNVYGGGSLSSVSAPKIGQSYLEYRKDDTSHTEVGKQTLNEVVVSGGQIGGDYSYDAGGNFVYGGRVFGGSRGDATLDATKFSTSMFTSVSINATNSPVIAGSVFGGGEVGIVKGSVDVTMNGGTVNKDVYGGGALANTNTENSSDVPYTTAVKLLGGLIKGDAYGGGLGRLHKDAVAADPANNIEAQPAVTAVEAMVYGDVAVTLGNETEDEDEASATAFMTSYYTGGHADVVKSGRVFGCNNLNGSPQGNVTVTVNRTVTGKDDDDENLSRTTSANLKKTDVAHTYEVAAVYGGGNLSAYAPTATGAKLKVLINSCDVSINEVYGGGNAASVPATDVEVKGSYEINHVFGGGNGKDDYTLDGGSSWETNPGANIGGNTNTILKGGLIHEAYGASNEKGDIAGDIVIDTGDGGCCPLDLEKMVGAGRNADVNGDLIVIMGCKPSQKINLLYAGADNANVNGNVELTITSGNFGKVFGGNNDGGAIRGHIIVNIEETGGCDTPITIDELYLGGNNAAYSRFGYYVKTNGNYGAPDETPVLTEGRLTFMPRTSADDPHKVVKTYNRADNSWTVYTGTGDDVFTSYAEPVLNVVSCTSIGQVYGGGYGTGGTMYANPTVNINMIPGHFAEDENVGIPKAMSDLGIIGTTENPNKLGIIGDVFGGGNAAAVIGNPTVNIGMATTVQCHESFDKTVRDETNDGYSYYDSQDVLGAYITGNVFGGGNLAEVSGNTYVNICGTQESNSESENGYSDTAVSHSDTEGFAISIGNSVYGGGNAADVLGNTFVTMADGYVFNGIFGGGLAGSVGTYERDKTVTVFEHNPEHEGTCIGKPTECTAGGTCYVVVSGGQIGPVTVATQGMNRTAANGGPVPQGWVWGGGCGIVEDPATHPDTHFKAYVNNTDVTIKDNAFILESIIGGGEFGRVLGNTLVKIKGGQIGVGEGQVANGKPKRYTEEQWTAAETAVRSGTASAIEAAVLTPCSHFPYGKVVDGKTVYKTYDPYADSYKEANNGSELYAGGSTDDASDGKTWIGCVFAGGSGYMPVVKAKNANGKVTDYDWISSAGWVEGNSEVRISGGHILTNVYGGNEVTSVGTEGVANKGKCKVTMTGGTIGVPRTRAQIEDIPMTGYLFGAGKGDPRSHFDTFTNVGSVEIEVSGGTIFGSVYGGSEDGHVLGNTDVKIQKNADSSKPDPFIGTWGTSYDGDVFGGGRGFSGENIKAGAVRGNIDVTIEGGKMLGSVYGGGELGSVGTFTVSDDMRTFTWGTSTEWNNTGVCTVTINGGTIGAGVEMSTDGSYANGNVFGAGKGRGNTFWCEKGIVYKTNVGITAGTVNGNVYGGGEVGRVETDAVVKIGPDTGTASPNIIGNVFGGGAGVKTHGYSALVRGNTYVTVQSSAQVGHNVYGGGQIAAVGKYYLVTADNVADHPGLSVGMPYSLVDDGLGICNVTVKGGATITGSVFGGGKGKEPENLNFAKPQGEEATNYHTSTYDIDDHMPKRMMNDYAGKNTYWEYYNPPTNTIIWEYFDTEDKYHTFLETLGLTTQSKVTIGGTRNNDGTVTASGSPTINGNVYGGSESGFVQHNTSVAIAGGTIGTETAGGNVFGGGLGLVTFAEAGRVRGNATVTINAGAVNGNVYGGGQLGDVGTIVKRADYNYKWTDADPSSIVLDTPATYPWNSTGVCTVTINGGTIGTGVAVSDDGTYANGNVYGAGKGLEDTWWCEKAMAYKTNVTITDGTINGTVYGGGQVGRVENDATVTIGTADETGTGSKPNITGNVFGAGAGVMTHGYSALVRGNADVTVQGIAQVGGCVYGGGEIASVGKFTVVDGLPKHPDSGGTCTVNILGHAKIGADGTGHNVFGACKGVTPAFVVDGENRSKSMQLYTNRPVDSPTLWSHYNNDENSPFIWRYYPNETAYRDFLETLALTSHPIVTIAEDVTVNGSVFGGGERGITLGSVEVNINGGTVTQDVYGGGSLANSNKGNWETTTNTWAEGKTSATYTTTVNLLGGTIGGDAYGGGLGQLEVGTEGQDGYVAPVEAKVYGDVYLNLNGFDKNEVTYDATIHGATGDGGRLVLVDNEYLVKDAVKGAVVNRIFGCNNLNGSPQGKVKVHVFKTQRAGQTRITNTTSEVTTAKVKVEPVNGEYNVAAFDVQAVYGGGNMAAYVPKDLTTGTTQVIIDGCDRTSIGQVYGGGNAASTPATEVTINGTFQIAEVFGGGNGKDKITINNVEKDNPGANVGFKDYSTVESTYDTKEKRQQDAFISNYVYGTGKANVNIFGGTVHRVFGGSNTKGNVRQSAITMLEEAEGCNFCVDEAYGGGKSAPMDAEAKLLMSCIPGLKEVYGGAQAADVYDNVAITITNGTFNRVFGGNNLSGTIRGSITVNIEETGCRPVIIGELYGGGNQAGYSTYGYRKTTVTNQETNTEETQWELVKPDDADAPTSALYKDPMVNVKSFTSIGTVYGGGYGERAVMVGNPTVNVSVAKGKWADDDQSIITTANNTTPNGIVIPTHEKTKIGAIEKVFGGGNAAKVIGNTNVNIGTEAYVYEVKNMNVGTSVSGYYTRSGNGTTSNPYVYTEATGTAAEGVTYYEKNPVVGADIRGNVYGGGNNAEVTGDTNVVVGRKEESTTTTPDPNSEP